MVGPRIAKEDDAYCSSPPEETAGGSCFAKSAGNTVEEIHIDFLLEEEFQVDPGFLRHFLEAAGRNGSDPPGQIERVERSVSDSCGEADLIVIYSSAGESERNAILIEDKIGAPFQPHQAERYRQRGKIGQTQGKWKQFWTCLVAPRSYIESKRDHGFDTSVSLEQIREWIAFGEPKRQEFKRRVICQAIKKAETIGVKQVDPIMTAFREKHYPFFDSFFENERQDVQLRAPAPVWRGESWFEIRSRLLPKRAYINHKAEMGVVDLTFPDTDAKRLETIRPHLETGMKIEQTGHSAAIRIEVSPIRDFADFDRERPKVAEALSAVRRLLNFYARERSYLDPVLMAAHSVLTTNNEIGKEDSPEHL